MILKGNRSFKQIRVCIDVCMVHSRTSMAYINECTQSHCNDPGCKGTILVF